MGVEDAGTIVGNGVRHRADEAAHGRDPRHVPFGMGVHHLAVLGEAKQAADPDIARNVSRRVGARDLGPSAPALPHDPAGGEAGANRDDISCSEGARDVVNQETGQAADAPAVLPPLETPVTEPVAPGSSTVP